MAKYAEAEWLIHRPDINAMFPVYSTVLDSSVKEKLIPVLI
ncbi:hypothetical protein [Paenibacillus taiwanensis]|nr:hypothetical protein [Paenibacillus taiwanensis]